MVAPIRYLSRRQQEQKIGILQNTEEKKVLEVIGRVGIGTTIFDAEYNLDVRGTANVSGSLSVGQIISGAGNTFSDLTVTGNTDLQSDVIIGGGLTVTGVSTFTSDVDINASVDISSNLTIAGVSTFQDTALFDDGTEAEPSISFINDTDLGLYRPADNEIAFTNGGSESVRIDDQGRVGIGSTQPGSTLVVNAPSGYTGDILDVKRTGDATSAFSLSRNNVLFRGLSAGDVIFVEYNSYLFYIGVDLQFHMSNHKFSLEDEGTYAWSSTTNANGTPDLTLYRDSANVLALRGGVNGGNNGIGQTFRIYNTYTSATDFERANVGWTTNTFIVGTEKGSAGGTARQLELQTDGTTRVSITTDGKVGIGTDNPGFDFHLFRTGDTTLVIESDRPNTDENANPKLIFRQDGGVNASAIGMNFDSDGVGNDLYIANSISSGAIRFLTGNTNGYTNATEALRITNAGNVGIGTDNPSQKLDVNGNVNIRGELHGPELFIIDPAAVGDNTGAVRIKGDLYVDGDNFIIDSETITLADFVVGIASTVPSNTLLDGAGIGIGSLNPGGQHYHTFLYEYNGGTNPSLKSSENLNVASGKVYQIAETERLSADTLSLGTGTTIHSPASNVLTFGTNNEERLRITSSGRLGIGTKNPNATVDIQSSSAELRLNSIGQNRSVFLNSATGLQIQQIGSQNITFETNGVERVRINSLGNVGIGTDTPSETLDVNGNIRLRSALYDNTNDAGDNGQLLISTGTGIEWGDLDGSGGGTALAAGQNIFDQQVGTPYYITASDITTGIATGGFIDTAIVSLDGNIGIGSTQPTAKLTVDVGTALTAFVVDGSEGQLFSVTNNLTSGSIFSVNDSSGVPSIDVDADGTIQLAPFGGTEYVGIGLTNPQAKLDVNGDVRLDAIDINETTLVGSATSSLTTVSSTPIYTGLSTSTYRSVEYTIQATEGANFHSTKILALHDGTTAYHSEYGTIFNNSSVATFDVDISGGNIRLLASGASASQTDYVINFVATKL